MDYLDEYLEEEEVRGMLYPDMLRVIEWISDKEGVSFLTAYHHFSSIYNGEVVTFDDLIEWWQKHKE